jgi:membrane protease YdiL (CAAX protease family)
MADDPASIPATRLLAPSRSKRRDLVELAIAYGLILLVIWTPRPAQRILWWVAAASVVYFTCVSFDGRQAMGLRAGNFFRSLWVVGAASAVSAIAVIVAIRLNTLHAPPGPLQFIATYWAYAIWGGVQQFLMQCFFLLRFKRILLSAKLAAVAAAGIFAAAHLPNPILTPVTLLWGLAACLLFLRYRNLYPLALAHAILGITVAITVPGPVDHNMRVGISYLAYGHRPHQHPQPLPQP